MTPRLVDMAVALICKRINADYILLRIDAQAVFFTVISETFTHKNLKQRYETMEALIARYGKILSKKYALVYEVVTPNEYEALLEGEQ